ncbi:CPBP family glutamic-type intramembrane protease [Pseudarthrobacter sp. YALA5]|uniref:CPBP family intramembrane glutamic endopeptidase n=1 Tax=Pseudarthrobacter sp. DSP2-3-2b1 TaxID=2804661 RepID=UPI00103EE8BE
MATANGRRRHEALEPRLPLGSGLGISSFLRRHPVTAYYTLVFAISWGGIVLTMGPGGLFSTGLTMSIAGGAFLTAGPCVANLILTVLLDGRAGLHRLFFALRRWRVGVRWYVVALLTGPVVIWGSTLGLSLAFPEFRPNAVPAGEALTIVVAGIALGLMVGVFEELGWTGFALPRLRRRFSILVTGLMMGLLWGAWHFPMFGGTTDPSGAVPNAVVIAAFLFAWLPPYRVLMVWVYDRTKSLLVAILMHAPISATTFVLASLGTTATSGIQLLVPVLVWGAVLWAIVGAVVWANGGRLTRT